MAKANTSQEPSMEEILASIRRIISDETPPAPETPMPAAKSAPAGKAAKAAPAPEPEESASISEEDLDKLFSQEDDADEPLDLAMPAEPEMVEEDEVLELVADEADDPLDLVEGLMPDEAEIVFADPAAEADDEPAMDLVSEEEDLVFEVPEPDPEPDFEPEPEPQPEPVPAPKAAAQPKPRPAPAVEDVAIDEPLVSRETTASVNAAFGSLTHTILSNNAKTLDDLVKEMLRPMLKGWLDENLPGIVERLVRAEIERVSRGR